MTFSFIPSLYAAHQRIARLFRLRNMQPSLLLTILALALSAAVAPAQSSPAKPPQPSAAQDSSAPSPLSEPDPMPALPTEDWNMLSVNDLHLPSYVPVVLERDVKADYTREVVRVQWRQGDLFDLYIFLPHGVPKAPAILYLYSYPSDIDRFYDEGWAQRAVKNGYAAVGFVSALTGERYKNRPMKEWFISELKESLAVSTHDVQMVLNYLSTRPDIDMNRIGMFGQGSGGSIAILAASVDSRIQALDLLNPWGDWPDWIKGSPQIPDSERPAFLKPEFLEKVKNVDPVIYLPGLKVPRLRIQLIEADPGVPAEAQKKIAAAAPVPGDVASFKNDEAHYTAMHLVGVSGWLKEQLQPSSTPAQSQGDPAKQKAALSAQVDRQSR